MTKTEARKLAKACRAAVDLHTVGHAMAGVLFTLPAWQHADTVLAFASMPDEPDTADILRQARGQASAAAPGAEPHRDGLGGDHSAFAVAAGGLWHFGSARFPACL